MKRPIDPNLENLTEDDFILDADVVNSNKEMRFAQEPEPKPVEEPNFVVTHAKESSNLADYHASDKHRSLTQKESFNLDEEAKTPHSSSSHHHHSSSSSGSHSSSSHHSSSGSSHHSSSGSSHHSSSGSSHHSSSGSSHHSSSGSSHHSSSSSSHHSSSSSSHHSSSKKKKLSTAAKIAITVLIILLLFIFAVVGTFIFLEAKGKSDMKTVTADAEYEEIIEYNGHRYKYNDDIISIAFIGVDKRDLGLENGVVGTAGQADADIILTVNTSTGRAKALAVPRDTMVDVDLYSENNIFLRTENMQLCLSYAYGNGKDTSATNVTTSLSRILYNVPINKYFALDLNGIAPINDAIGGVTLTSLYDFSNVDIKKGQTVHLEGDLTEAYVRTRELDNVEASLNRTARQVQYIKAFAAQLLPAVTSDFSVISKLYNTAADYSTTNISLSNATYLASLMLSKGITDFETQTLEGEMKQSTNEQYQDFVYAEFYPDQDKLLETVLDIFYEKVD
ncbi:MAG: LCP family protein [Eubacterium sp.]